MSLTKSVITQPTVRRLVKEPIVRHLSVARNADPPQGRRAVPVRKWHCGKGATAENA